MKIFKVISVLGLAIIASACGNIQQQPYDNLQTSSYGQITNSSAANPYLSAAQSCSENPNIVSPQYQYATQSQYRACKATNNNSLNVQIFTADNSVKNVCVFPIQIIGTTTNPFIINPYAPVQSRFAFQCVTVAKDTGATMSFGSLPISGIMVVDQTDAFSFAGCLASGTFTTCASNLSITYSLGNL